MTLSVPWEVINTIGDVQYQWGKSRCICGILSTLGDVQYHGGYLEYHGVFVPWGNIMSNVGDKSFVI